MEPKIRYVIPEVLPSDIAVELFVSWVQRFAGERLGLDQSGYGTDPDGHHVRTFGDPTAGHFTLKQGDRPHEWSIALTQGVAAEAVAEIVADAVAHVAASDFGGDVVYEVHMESHELQLFDARGGLNFIRTLGDQVRFVGERRLGTRVLLDFSEEALPAAPAALIAPKARIRATLFVPGPAASRLSQTLAFGVAEITSAICAFSIGRPVEFSAPELMFPADDATAANATAKRSDPAISNLARESVSLDIFDDLLSRGGAENVYRVRGALLSYQAAMEQRSADVATELFVSAIEALFAPTQPWRKERITTRFIKGLQELCPDAVVAMLQHANVEEAFGYRKHGGAAAQRRQLVDRIYEMRSMPSHEGIGLTGGVPLSMIGNPSSLRVMLLSALARSAILAYLQAPRSSLIGHPATASAE